MSNEIYLTPRVSESLDQLPKDQQTRVVRMIDSFGEDVLRNSIVVAADDSPGGGLRAARAKDYRLLFRYVPETHTVIITDLAKWESEELSAATA
jgi:mRNA-degrading endonuclease RelE of RelBE toxin-antitoxin system